MKQKKPLIIAASVGALWLLMDALSKSWAQSSGLPITHNTGIAFGLPVPFWIQIVGSIMILGLIGALAKEFMEKHEGDMLIAGSAFFGMVVGGALGNLINRIGQGHVVDFIHLPPFPTFNIADIGITVGLTLIFLLSLKKPT